MSAVVFSSLLLNCWKGNLAHDLPVEQRCPRFFVVFREPENAVWTGELVFILNRTSKVLRNAAEYCLLDKIRLPLRFDEDLDQTVVLERAVTSNQFCSSVLAACVTHSSNFFISAVFGSASFA